MSSALARTCLQGQQGSGGQENASGTAFPKETLKKPFLPVCSTAFENAVSGSLHFQAIGHLKMAGASCPLGKTPFNQMRFPKQILSFCD